MGLYCKYCQQRCFARIPMDAPIELINKYPAGFVFLSTCSAGQAAEKAEFGICYDELTAPARAEWRVQERDDVMMCKVFGPSRADGSEWAALFETSDKPMARKVVAAINAYPAACAIVEAVLAQTQDGLDRSAHILELAAKFPLPAQTRAA